MYGFNFIPVIFFSLNVSPCYSVVLLSSSENYCCEQIIYSGFASSTFFSCLRKEITSYILPLENNLFIPEMCLKKDTINLSEERDLNLQLLNTELKYENLRR